MELQCGCKAPAPKFTSAQVFAAKTMGQVITAGLLLTCPNGHGLIEVVPAADRTPVAVPAGYVDPWAV